MYFSKTKYNVRQLGTRACQINKLTVKVVLLFYQLKGELYSEKLSPSFAAGSAWATAPLLQDTSGRGAWATASLLRAQLRRLHHSCEIPPGGALEQLRRSRAHDCVACSATSSAPQKKGTAAPAVLRWPYHRRQRSRNCVTLSRRYCDYSHFHLFKKWRTAR